MKKREKPVQLPPNNSQPPNDQQHGHGDTLPSNQPTQDRQQQPPRLVLREKPLQSPTQKTKKPMAIQDKILGYGCLGLLVILFLSICGVLGTAANANRENLPTITVTNTSTAAVKAILPTNTPTITSTEVPTPTTQPTPQPTATPCANPCNPWGYNFMRGYFIYNPYSAFCSYFKCINTFWYGHGFVNECNDGSYSKTGGIRGNCDYHGGEYRPLFSR